MNLVYTQKIEMIKALRSFFVEKGATEVFTPVTRKTTSMSIQRVETEFRTFLRNCQELQLRLMMAYYGDVFEIGPCFRREAIEDATHGREFTLLEAQFSNKDLSFLIGSLKEYISSQHSGFIFEEVSVVGEILQKTGIDVVEEGEEKLVRFLQNLYPSMSFTQNYQYINYFIQQEIEPMSKGRCVFFTEYPSCTLSLARYTDTSKEVINRFELFIDGIEVSNGYENSIDVDEFVERNKRVGMFTEEEQYLEERLRDGSIPTRTAIIGIGVERLCMTIYNIPNIQLLLHENSVF